MFSFCFFHCSPVCFGLPRPYILQILHPRFVFGTVSFSIGRFHEAVTQNVTKHSIWDTHEIQENDKIKLDWVWSKNNVADMFTKALPKDDYLRLRERLMGYSLGPPPGKEDKDE